MLQNKLNEKIESLFVQYNIDVDTVAVGVSGGADSLALVLLLKLWAKDKNIKIVALTVDHKLRDNSTAEALYVQKVMKAFDVEHHILSWEGEKPKSSMEELARFARYGLLQEWCVENNVSVLMMAHHKLDQAETFFIRLQRGSGVDGLSGMAEVSELGNMKLVRPLLDFFPEEMKAFLQSQKIEWVDDPHNVQDDFLRVRIRKFLPQLEEITGISIDRIADTMATLSKTRAYLEEQTEKFIKNNIKDWNGRGVSFSRSTFSALHNEIGFRVLSLLIKKIGNNHYSSRADSIEHLIALLKQEFKGATLGGCEVFDFAGKIWIVPELKGSVKLSKKQWEEFVEQNPIYKKIKIPYKLKLSLCL